MHRAAGKGGAGMTDENIKNEYRFNSRFRKYVDRYCAQHKIPVSEALRHEIVRQVCMSYTEV